MRKRAETWLIGIGKYVIGFGVLAAVMYRYWQPDAATGSPGLRHLFGGPIEWKWLLMSLLMIVVASSLQIIRWYLFVCALQIPFALWRAFQLGLLGLFANTFLPGAVGGDVLKAYFLAKDNPAQRTAAISTVLMDRGMGLFGLILFAAVLGSIAWASGDSNIRIHTELQWVIAWSGAISIASVSGFVFLGFLPKTQVQRLAGWLRSLPLIGAPLAELWRILWEFRQHMRMVGYAVGLSAMAHLALVLSFYAATRVFAAESPQTDLITLPELVVIGPIGFIAQALPISPGGVGVGEAAFAGLFRLLDRPESRGVVARLAMRIAEWVIALAALIVYFKMREEVRGAKEQLYRE